MTNEQFSNEFDVLINSNAISKPFGAGDSLFEFNEYEKSVFLTKAQETIIRQLYNGTLTGTSFEETQELRRYLSTLIKTKEATCTNNNDGTYTVIFNAEDGVWFIVQEEAVITKNGCTINADIVPVRHDELNRIRRNPFRGNYNNRILRADRYNSGESMVLYPPKNATIDKYIYRYIQQPEPIILENLPDGLTILKVSTKNECKLNPILHPIILDTAVSLAIKTKSSMVK